MLDLLLPGAAVVLAFALRSPARASSAADEPVDVAEWGFAFTGEAEGSTPVYDSGAERAWPGAGSGSGRRMGQMLEWRRPRDVRRVVLRGDALPSPGSVRLEYWYRIWPGWRRRRMVRRLDDPVQRTVG